MDEQKNTKKFNEVVNKIVDRLADVIRALVFVPIICLIAVLITVPTILCMPILILSSICGSRNPMFEVRHEFKRIGKILSSMIDATL